MNEHFLILKLIIFSNREAALLELGIMTKNDGNALGIFSPKKVILNWKMKISNFQRK